MSNLVKKTVALKYAHDIRKFEIELLWKRSAFLWTLVSVIFSAVLGIYLAGIDSHNTPVVLALSVVGLTLSIIWYFLNRGSKFWQEKWESSIEGLENRVTGPLYKLTPEQASKGSFFPLNGAYRFSPSRLLINVSFLFVLLWVAVIAWQVAGLLPVCLTPVWTWTIAILISTVSTAVVSWAIFMFSRSA